MEMLANYDEDSEPMCDTNSSFENEKIATEQKPAIGNLEDQYSMFEKMIGTEVTTNEHQSTDVSKSDGVIANPPVNIENTVPEGSDVVETSSQSVGKCSLAESVKKIMEKSSEVGQEPGGITRSKSVSSDSASSRESSKSRSPSSSPERKSRERKISTNSLESDKMKPADEDKHASKSPSKRQKSKSRSPSHKRRSDHHKSSRKRSRSRDRRKENHSSRSRRHKRSRSRDRKHKRRHSSRDRRRSRSGSKDRHKKRRRSRSRDKHSSKKSRRSRSRHRSPHRHYKSPERHRRSLSPDRKCRRSPTTANKPFTFKDHMRQQLLKASKILQNNEGIDGKELELPKEKPSNLPLNSKDIFSAISSNSGVTPQMALLQTMATMHQKAQEMTGIAVPKYYNPAAVNPLKYAEQVQKRKLLWSKAKDHKEDKEKEWKTSASLASDSDGKTQAKFCKLMGIKDEGEHQNEVTEDNEQEILDEKKKQHDEFFSRLDKDYEFARMTTHTQRGVGLGFSSSHQFPVQHQ